MAQLPVIKRLVTEDFPEQKGWIGTLFDPLNQVLSLLSSAFANGFTLQQNLMTQVKTLSIDGSAPTISFPYLFSPQIPIGVTVIDVAQTNTATVVVAAVGCTWSISSGLITTTVQGLDAAGIYNVTFVVWGG